MAPTPLTPAEQHIVNLGIGPMQIGNFVNSILMGVLIIQGGQYFIHFRDPYWIRGLVILCLLFDVAQSALMMYMSWEYAVTHYADLTFLSRSNWALSSIPFFSVPVSWIVQGFFAWRIYILTKKLIFPAIVSLFALIQGAFGIYAGIASFMDNSTADNVHLQKIATAWFTFAMLCDVTIMIVMLWSLSLAKTGLRDTDTLITRINRAVLETGGSTTATVLVDCLFLFLIPGTDMHLVPVMAVGKVYSNSFLYILNSRGRYRKISTPCTADFARTFDQPCSMQVEGHGGMPSGRRGLAALKFAPNDAASRNGGGSVGQDTERGVYISRDRFVMTNIASDVEVPSTIHITPAASDAASRHSDQQVKSEFVD